MSDVQIGILGATSIVGQDVLELLSDKPFKLLAFSRRQRQMQKSISFIQLTDDTHLQHIGDVPYWLNLAPIWTLPEHFSLLKAHGAKRVVALSSTSIFTKKHSSDSAEQKIAEKLQRGERALIEWAEANDIHWIILRPTLIYGHGLDRNISEIARIISRFGFFPLLGKATGLRQPVHAQDVASACVAALLRHEVNNRSYELSGGEQLTYREMVSRIFHALGKSERFIPIPLPIFKFAVLCLRVFPRFRHWRAAMAQRMNNDLVFDHSCAAKDLNFTPRLFNIRKCDFVAE